MGVLEITIIIAGPVFVICLIVVMCFFYIWQKKNGNKQLLPQNEALLKKYLADCTQIEGSGPCLKDMIEMTTSGSGSG